MLYKLDISQGTTQATPYTYEVIGGRAQLARVTIPSVGLAAQQVHYYNDLSGQVLNRWNGNGGGAPKEYFYRFGGKEMGHITNDGTRETSSSNRSRTGRRFSPHRPVCSTTARQAARPTARSPRASTRSRHTIRDRQPEPIR